MEHGRCMFWFHMVLVRSYKFLARVLAFRKTTSFEAIVIQQMFWKKLFIVTMIEELYSHYKHIYNMYKIIILK